MTQPAPIQPIHTISSAPSSEEIAVVAQQLARGPRDFTLSAFDPTAEEILSSGEVYRNVLKIEVAWRNSCAPIFTTFGIARQPSTLIVFDLEVPSELRGRGVGSETLTRLEEIAANLGIRTVEAHKQSHLGEYQGFFEKRSYATVKREHKDGVEIMRKSLTEPHQPRSANFLSAYGL